MFSRGRKGKWKKPKAPRCPKGRRMPGVHRAGRRGGGRVPGRQLQRLPGGRLHRGPGNLERGMRGANGARERRCCLGGRWLFLVFWNPKGTPQKNRLGFPVHQPEKNTLEITLTHNYKGLNGCVSRVGPPSKKHDMVFLYSQNRLPCFC